MNDFEAIMEEFDNSQGANSILYRNRPYEGQPHTCNGVRGKTEVKGLTFRDVKDCFILGAFDAANDQFDEEKKERWRLGRMTENEIYSLDCNRIDPIAWQQCMSVRLEKMMGIYPNVPPLETA